MSALIDGLSREVCFEVMRRTTGPPTGDRSRPAGSGDRLLACLLACCGQVHRELHTGRMSLSELYNHHPPNSGREGEAAGGAGTPGRTSSTGANANGVSPATAGELAACCVLPFSMPPPPRGV